MDDGLRVSQRLMMVQHHHRQLQGLQQVHMGAPHIAHQENIRALEGHGSQPLLVKLAGQRDVNVGPLSQQGEGQQGRRSCPVAVIVAQDSDTLCTIDDPSSPL